MFCLIFFSVKTTYFPFFCSFNTHDIETKTLQRVKFWIKKKRNALFFEFRNLQHVRFGLKNSQRVRFWIEIFPTPQIMNQNIFAFFNPKVYFSLTTCTFHIVFLHLTMYKYSLQYLCQLDISIRRHSNNTSCARFCTDLDFLFRYGVPLYSLYGIDICRNLLLPVKLLITILELFLTDTCLTNVKTKHACYSLF